MTPPPLKGRSVSLALLVALCAGCAASPLSSVDEDGKLVVHANGQPFTEFHYEASPKPYLYPLHGPGGVALTRNWPMRAAPDEARDHPHHQSLWFAHGDVNGFDFWHGTDAGERIVHDGLLDTFEQRGAFVVSSRHLWMAGETHVLTEERTMRLRAGEGERSIDFELTLSPGSEDVVFGDTKEGTMALRLAPTLRLKGEVAAGSAVNSAGQHDGECWGKRAAWVAYWGPVEGRTVTVALFDHPTNPRYPTWWHARDYGLFAANPFGVHDFERKPVGTGDLTLRRGESITFRYRLLLRDGPADVAALDAELARYAAGD